LCRDFHRRERDEAYRKRTRARVKHWQRKYCYNWIQQTWNKKKNGNLKRNLPVQEDKKRVRTIGKLWREGRES